MKEYATQEIRNVALAAHGGTGKTSLTEAMAFRAGLSTASDRVDEGTTLSDFDPDEVKRKISVNLSVIPWSGRAPKSTSRHTRLCRFRGRRENRAARRGQRA